MYKSELIAAGLTKKQADVYLACLTLGPSKIPDVAREAQIKRTTVYGIVDELVGMGLLQSNYRGKRKLFEAQDPKVLLAMLDARKKRVTDAIPELTELFATRHVRPHVTFFEGREGVKKIYDDVLECRSKQLKQIVRARQHNEVVGDVFINEFIRKRIERGITTRNLHPKYGDLYTSDRGMEDPKRKRFVRYLPPNVFYAAIIMIYDHKVAMVSTKEENFGFIIESKEFSNTLSAYFDFMWGLGSKEPDIER
jgi:sugar-specific transcriptional regulator TrmB